MEASTLGGLLAGSIVAVTLASFKLIEKVLARQAKRNGPPSTLPPVQCGFNTDAKAATFDTRRDVHLLVKQHAPEGGVELWKWPKELTQIIHTVAETQRAQTRLMEVWGESLTSHQRSEERILIEIRDALRDVASASADKSG